jgi:hypothetical protein
MLSLNDHNAWEGNINDVIAMSIRDNGRRSSTRHMTTMRLVPAARLWMSLPTWTTIYSSTTTAPAAAGVISLFYV